MSNIKQLIDSIVDENSYDILDTFDAIMADKVVSNIDAMREHVAKNMFNDQSDVTEEYQDEYEVLDEEFEALDETKASTKHTDLKQWKKSALAKNCQINKVHGKPGVYHAYAKGSSPDSFKFAGKFDVNKGVGNLHEDFEQLDEYETHRTSSGHVYDDEGNLVSRPGRAGKYTARGYAAGRGRNMASDNWKDSRQDKPIKRGSLTAQSLLGDKRKHTHAVHYKNKVWRTFASKENADKAAQGFGKDHQQHVSVHKITEAQKIKDSERKGYGKRAERKKEANKVRRQQDKVVYEDK